MHRYTRISFSVILAVFAIMLVISGAYVYAQSQLERYHELDYLTDYTYMNEETNTLVRIYVDGDTRYFETNVLPDHETGNFPNPGNPHTLSAQDLRFTTPAEPEVADEITEVGLGKFGLALNGVPFEREAAEWYNRDRDSGWQYDAFGGGVQLGFDLNNAHVQPSGLYHYHGVPDALIAEEDPEEHPLLVGYAGDGFPIYLYYSYEDPEDTDSDIISLTPSYQLREGNRNGGPGGTFDGTFNEDWEYVEGSGDLDECNGRTGSTPDYPDGTYYYVLTEAFPRVPTCWSGTIGEGWSPPQPGRR